MSFTPRWRDVYLISTARAVSYCGDFLAATALALALQSRGDNGYGVAALLIASALPLALLAPLAGRLADRFDSRTLLVVTGAAQAGVCFALAYTTNPVLMVALLAVMSSGVAITQPTMTALLPDMVGKERLPRAMSIGQTANAVGMFLGPALGGLLVGGYGVRLPLLLDAVTYLALAGVAMLVQTRRGGRHRTLAATEGTTAAEGTAATGMAAGSPVAAPAWRLRSDRLLVTMIASLAAVISAVTAMNVVEIFFVRETLGGSEAMYGLVSATWVAGLLIGAWPWGRIRGEDGRLANLQLFLLAGVSVVVLLSATVSTALWLIPLYLLGGSLNAGLNVMAGVLLGRRVPAEVRGRVAGVFSSAANTANITGYVLGGALLAVYSPRMIILGTGVAGILVAAAFLVPAVLTGPARARRAAQAEVA